ncbi:MAG: hypothetical protein ACTSW7_03885 [Candidatus Thorarchaeota archaeon]
MTELIEAEICQTTLVRADPEEVYDRIATGAISDKSIVSEITRRRLFWRSLFYIVEYYD